MTHCVSLSPSVQAIPTVHSSGGSNPLTALYERISQAYANAVKALVAFLQRHDWHVAGAVLGTLLAEPLQSIKAAIFNITNLSSDFHFYGMNPLTGDGSKFERPVLLIHGNFHNQSAWLSLAKKLKDKNIGPVYTVNLPCGPITETDLKIVCKKIAQIKRQCRDMFGKRRIKVDLVGHSRGGYIAESIAGSRLKTANDIGKVISIGTVLSRKKVEKAAPCIKRTYEITGNYDALTTASSSLPAKRQRAVNTGHLGLLYSSEVHDQIIDWLQGR